MLRQSAFPPPPVAAPKAFTHADGRPDAWAWLRDPGYPDVTDPEILGYLTAENAYVETILGGEGDLRPALLAELKSRVIEDERTPPEWHHGVWLWGRFQPGQQYGQTCLAGSLEEAKANRGTVILDQNERAEGRPYYALRGLALSPDRRFLAVLEDTDGSERLVLRVKDLASGAFLPLEIGDCTYGLEWSNDSRRIFYVKQDAQQRPRWVYAHTLGSDPATDGLIYHEADPTFYLGIERSASGRYLFISVAQKTCSEQWVLSLEGAGVQPRCLNPRRANHEYGAFDRNGEWLILTNDTHPNFRVVRAPIDTPEEAAWQEVVAPSDAVFIEGIGGTKHFWWLSERTDEARKRVRIVARDQTSDVGAEEVTFPDPAYALWVLPGSNWDGTSLRLRYETLARPKTYFDYHVGSKRLEILQQTEIPGGHDPDAYIVERLWATAPDGERVPLSVVRRKGVPLDGTAPALLYGYGSYGASMDAAFSTNRLSLLNRGFVYAIAHIRGGEERGRRWYEDGKFLKKKNTFTDFIAAGEHLIAQGYTQKGRIACMGGSAGGLLMGAVLNQRPDLWGASVAQVPFVDVLSTMLDDSLPLTAFEYEEWGNPADPAYYAYMQSYSPYDQVTAQAYPPILITAGLSDPRVTYWEPAKWAAKLRATKTDDSVLLLRTEMSAGHGGASGRYKALEEIAETYAFLLAALARAA
ncbi:MAG: S9 family peptidase [Elstera sp.]